MVAEGRGKGRPKLTEAGEIDQAIRDAALRVLLEYGETATMNAVAVTAGISRKSLYARHPNKTELFLETIRDLLMPVGGLEYDASGPVQVRLQNYVEAAFQVISRPESLTIQRLLTIDPAYISALRTEMLDATRAIFFDPLVDLLAAAKARDELVIDDVEATARAVIRLILAECMPLEGRPISSGANDGHAEYARFLTRLITLGTMPR